MRRPAPGRRAALLALLVVIAATACTRSERGRDLETPSPAFPSSISPAPPSAPGTPAPTGRVTVSAELVAGDLDQPAAFTFLPDGRILYGERISGRIKLLDPASGAVSRFFELPDVVGKITTGGGLLGLVAHPSYPDEPFVYAFATRSVPGGERSQIVRIAARDDRGSSMKVVYDPGIPSSVRHNGGRMLFGPDGMLYVLVGEHDLPSSPQDLQSPIGKIHRMTPAGRPAPGNPFRHSTVFAFGVRNSFGMDSDPSTGDLWYTDNGPECNDEVNRVVPGGNYGWGPSAGCTSTPGEASTNRDGPDPIEPAWLIHRTIGISGLTFCDGCGLGNRSEGALFYGDFNLNRIHRLTLTDDRRGVRAEMVVLTHERHVLSLESGPDGTIYLSDPQAIYRLVGA